MFDCGHRERLMDRCGYHVELRDIKEKGFDW
jgi:hypothetical protein